MGYWCFDFDVAKQCRIESYLPKPPARDTAVARSAFAVPYIGALDTNGVVVSGNHCLRREADMMECG
jgi:hypothetical protein